MVEAIGRVVPSGVVPSTGAVVGVISGVVPSTGAEVVVPSGVVSSTGAVVVVLAGVVSSTGADVVVLAGVVPSAGAVVVSSILGSTVVLKAVVDVLGHSSGEGHKAQRELTLKASLKSGKKKWNVVVYRLLCKKVGYKFETHLLVSTNASMTTHLIRYTLVLFTVASQSTTTLIQTCWHWRGHEHSRWYSCWCCFLNCT